MRTKNKKIKKTAQEIQDNIFLKMSADRRVEVGSQLWKLAKALVGDNKLWKKKIQDTF